MRGKGNFRGGKEKRGVTCSGVSVRSTPFLIDFTTLLYSGQRGDSTPTNGKKLF